MKVELFGTGCAKCKLLEKRTRAALQNLGAADATVEKIEDMAAIIPIYFYTTMAMDKPYLTRYHDSLSGNNFWLWSIDWEGKIAAQ